MGMPGTKPFFEALWAVMRLQVLPEQLGGAGPNRIQWEFDDAVFKEAAYVPALYLALHLWPNISPLSRSGKDFMLEAIDVLKGVGSSFSINIL